MRGKPLRRLLFGGVARITPADAGKTERRRQRDRSRGDHPRGCGENVIHPVPLHRQSGSPPRMRGKRANPLCVPRKPGITPADAGKTLVRSVKSSSPQDHPRGCGENATKPFTVSAIAGSPPRMRGKLLRQCSYRSLSRITPADAGKTGCVQG